MSARDRVPAAELFLLLVEAEEYVAEASEHMAAQDIFLALALRSTMGSDN